MKSENLHGGLQGVVMTSTALWHEDVPRHQMGFWDKSDMYLYNLGTRSRYTCTYQLWECKHMSLLVNWIFIYEEAKKRGGSRGDGFCLRQLMGSRLPLAGKKTAVVSCCHKCMDWGMAVKTRRNGRRMRKQRTELEGEDRGGGMKGREGRGRRRGMCLPVFMSPPSERTVPAEHFWGCFREELWLIHAARGCSSRSDGRAWDFSKIRGGSTRGEEGESKVGKEARIYVICAP